MPARVVAAIAWPSPSKVIQRSPEGVLRSTDSSMRRRASTSTPTRARALPRSSRTTVETVATGRPSALSPCFQARSPAGVDATGIAGRGAASREGGGWRAWSARITRAVAPDAVSTDRERITARRSSVRSRPGTREWIRARSSRAAEPDASSESRKADDPAGRPTIVNRARGGIRPGERPTGGRARARAALVESATATAVSSTRRARRSIHSARYRASS